MTASELRIGNWVKNNYDIGNNLSCDTQVDIDILCDIAHGYTFDFEPIELSPDWLERLGFVKVSDKVHDKYRIKPGNAIYEFSIREKYGIENGNCGIMGVAYDEQDIENGDGTTYHQGQEWNGFAWHIKYLHQLQNLYHALTGEELITGEKEGEV